MFLQVQVPEQDRSCLSFICPQGLMNPFRCTHISVTYLELRVLQLLQTILSSEWDWTMKRSIQLNQSNTKQLPHGRFHQIGRKPWRSQWGFQSTTTSSLTTWIWTEEVDKQQRCSYRSNLRRLEVSQQHETSRCGIQYGGILCATTAMDRYWWQSSSVQRYEQGSWNT